MEKIKKNFKKKRPPFRPRQSSARARRSILRRNTVGGHGTEKPRPGFSRPPALSNAPAGRQGNDFRIFPRSDRFIHDCCYYSKPGVVIIGVFRGGGGKGAIASPQLRLLNNFFFFYTCILTCKK